MDLTGTCFPVFVKIVVKVVGNFLDLVDEALDPRQMMGALTIVTALDFVDESMLIKP